HQPDPVRRPAGGGRGGHADVHPGARGDGQQPGVRDAAGQRRDGQRRVGHGGDAAVHDHAGREAGEPERGGEVRGRPGGGALGDVDGDGAADIAVSPDQGGGGRVEVYSGRGTVRFANFFGIDDTAFRGGARVAFGDFNADGVADLAVAAGFQGGPRVALYDG